MSKAKKLGFTLIELLVVISIIGLLSTLAVVALKNARVKARDTVRMDSLRRLRTALELYFDDNKTYPVVGGWWGQCIDYGSHPLSGANGWIPNLAPTYIGQLPTDPDTNKRLCGNSSCYLYYSNGVDYKVLAHCIPETYLTNNPFYDPTRPTWAWQISTQGGRNW